METMPLWVAEMPQIPQKDVSDKKYIDNKETKAYIDESNDLSDLDDLSRKVLGCLGKEPVPVDDVVAQVDAPAAEVLRVLTNLSLFGKVVNHPGRMVSVK